MEDWYFRLPKNKTIIKIPKGFEFDGASIPRPFWWILSPVGLLFIPGLVHMHIKRMGSLVWRSIETHKGSLYLKKILFPGKQNPSGMVYLEMLRLR